MKTAPLLALLLLASCSRDDATTTPPPARSAARVPAPAPRAEAAPGSPSPAIVPPGARRVLELEGGVRVEIVAEGQGEFIGAGDEVALSLTLSFVPPPEPAPAPADPSAKPAAGQHREPGSKRGGGQPSPQQTGAQARAQPADAGSAPPVAATGPLAAATDAAHAEVPPSAAPSTDAAPSESAASGRSAAEPAGPRAPAGPEPSGSTSEASQPAPAEASSSEGDPPTRPDAAAPEGSAPAPVPLEPAREPVILVSTSESGVPIRARVGERGALLPGLSRALVGLRAGTIAEITIPAESAYGASGLPAAGIPPATPLHARIEVREVRR